MLDIDLIVIWPAREGTYIREAKDPQASVGQVDPRWLRRARAGYYGHMTHIDHQLNRFLEVLHEFRLRENTYLGRSALQGRLIDVLPGNGRS